MNIYSRKILLVSILKTLDASFCVEMVSGAVRLYGSPGIINIGQGSQLPPVAFVAAVTVSGAKLSMYVDGDWTDNICIERFWRSRKVE